MTIIFLNVNLQNQLRAVAQRPSVHDWGSWGRRFKSGQPDILFFIYIVLKLIYRSGFASQPDTEKNMQILKVYLKLLILFLVVLGMFYGLKSLSDRRRGAPVPMIAFTSVTTVTETGAPIIKAEVEVRNNGGKGYVVVTAKATAGSETWEKTIDLFMRQRTTHTLQFIFDDPDIADKNPEFDFHTHPFFKN